MKPNLRSLLMVFAVLLLATVTVTTAWQLGVRRTASQNPKGKPLSEDRFAAFGPISPSFCGPLQALRPPPRIDSPYGHHLYADTAAERIIPLPVMEVMSRLSQEKKAPKTMDEHAEAEENALDDVQTVVLLLEEYRRVFGAMPQGELNEEIVRRLQGENPKGIAVLPRSHPNLNSNGELLDRWGTPYRFHPENAWLTTVRSAGPDREMWTADDLISEEPDSSEASSLTASF